MLWLGFSQSIQWPVIAFLIGILTSIYFYLNRNLKYWESKNISGPKPIPIFGNSLSGFLKARNLVEVEWYRKYGRIFGLFAGYKPALSVAEPELIKQILVKDFHSFRNRRNAVSNHKVFSKIMFNARDEDWKRIRAIASPTFTSGKLKKMYSLINKCCEEFLQALDSYAKDDKEIDLKLLNGAYTMDVIASCAFAAKTNTHKDPNNPFTKNARALFNVEIWKVVLLLLLPTFLSRNHWVRGLVSTRQSALFFTDFTRHVIRQRKANNEKHNDFLQLLMDVERNDDKSNQESDVSDAHYLNEGSDELKADLKALSGVTEKTLDENEILAQCLLFFLAGYETTATTLSFCSYELALNPEIQEKLFEETKGAFDENGVINHDVLSKLPYLDSVLSETLRMYPPVIRLEREAMEDIELGDTGITINKGVIAEIPVYAIHHDKAFYENPEVFNPERFMPENRSNIKPYTYLPFGIGPRNCIGMRFALLEAKLALAKIIQKFRFFRTPNTDVPIIFNKGRSLVQAKRLMAGIRRI